MYSASADGGLALAAEDTPFHGQGHYLKGPRASFSGGAGLLSTSADYTRFLEAIRLGGGAILGRKSVESMLTNHIGQLATFIPGSGFGLGFALVQDTGPRGEPGTPGEFGWGGAYHTSYWVDPVEALTVVYMTQILPAPGLDDFARIRALIYQALD